MIYIIQKPDGMEGECVALAPDGRELNNHWPSLGAEGSKNVEYVPNDRVAFHAGVQRALRRRYVRKRKV